MASTTRLAWLFDVDGTLLLTGGAAREAFACAVRDHLGVEDDLRDIGFSGRIEPLILRDILRKHGRSFDAAEEARFWDSVFAHMRRLLRPGRGRLMPGIPQLLDRIAAEPGWVMGLLTGNMTQMARIKLGHFGLDGRFAFGGFGEMAAGPRRPGPRAGAARRARARRAGPALRRGGGHRARRRLRARGRGAGDRRGDRRDRPSAPLAAAEPDLLLDDLRGPPSAASLGLGRRGRRGRASICQAVCAPEHPTVALVYGRMYTIPMATRANVDQGLDAKDRSILSLIQRDGKMRQAQIAQHVGLSTAAVNERLKKLEQAGRHPPLHRAGGPARPSASRSPRSSRSSSSTRATRRPFIERMLELDEVQECHHITGEFSLLLKVRVRDMESLQRAAASASSTAPRACARPAPSWCSRPSRRRASSRPARRREDMNPTTTPTGRIAPAEVHATLARHMLADGYDIVLDLEKSQGRRLCDARSGRWYPRHVLVLRHAAGGDQPPAAEGARVPRPAARAPRSPTRPTPTSTRSRWPSSSTPSAASRMPDYLPHAFFVAGGTLGVENALKAAFDWKVRRNFRKGSARRRATRSSTSARRSTAARATRCR